MVSCIHNFQAVIFHLDILQCLHSIPRFPLVRKPEAGWAVAGVLSPLSGNAGRGTVKVIGVLASAPEFERDILGLMALLFLSAAPLFLFFPLAFDCAQLLRLLEVSLALMLFLFPIPDGPSPPDFCRL